MSNSKKSVEDRLARFYLLAKARTAEIKKKLDKYAILLQKYTLEQATPDDKGMYTLLTEDHKVLYKPSAVKNNPGFDEKRAAEKDPDLVKAYQSLGEQLCTRFPKAASPSPYFKVDIKREDSKPKSKVYLGVGEAVNL